MRGKCCLPSVIQWLSVPGGHGGGRLAVLRVLSDAAGARGYEHVWVTRWAGVTLRPLCPYNLEMLAQWHLLLQRMGPLDAQLCAAITGQVLVAHRCLPPTRGRLSAQLARKARASLPVTWAAWW